MLVYSAAFSLVAAMVAMVILVREGKPGSEMVTSLYWIVQGSRLYLGRRP
jgi:hypothetical protein